MVAKCGEEREMLVPLSPCCGCSWWAKCCFLWSHVAKLATSYRDLVALSPANRELLLPGPEHWAEPLPPSWERQGRQRLPPASTPVPTGDGPESGLCSPPSHCTIALPPKPSPAGLWSCDHLCGAVTVSVLPMCTQAGGGPELPHALHGITMILWAVVGDPCSLLPLQAVASFPITPTSLEAFPVPSLTLGLLLWVLSVGALLVASGCPVL